MVKIESPERFQNDKINVISVLKLSFKDLAIGQVSAIAGDAAFIVMLKKQ